jgi:hypothetical protein
MVLDSVEVAVYFDQRSSLASHDRQRREMEAWPERFAVGPLMKTY